MKKQYRIYIGRFCVSRFESDSLIDATVKWAKIAEEMKSDGTVTLYDGPRNIANECCKQVISGTPARKKGGENR